jgi:hypothetical protein
MKLSSLISDTVFYQQSEMQYFQTLSYNNTPKNNRYHCSKRGSSAHG